MKIIRIITPIVAVFLLACMGDARAGTTVAVSASNFANDKDGAAAFVFEVLQTELAAKPGIELVDRKKLHDVLAEQGLGAGGFTGEKAAQVGKLVGAGYYVFADSLVAGNKVAVTCRVVQVETGLLQPVLVPVGRDEDPMVAGARAGKQVADAIAKLAGRAAAEEKQAPEFKLPANAVLPVIAMRIPEASATPQQRRPDPAAEKALESFFLRHGFKLVQLSRPSQSVDAATPALHLEGPAHEALLAEARDKGAGVIILGIATSDRATQIGQFSAARARVELAAVDARTSKVLAATSGYGTGTDLSAFVAEKKAIESAANSLLPAFTTKIAEGAAR